MADIDWQKITEKKPPEKTLLMVCGDSGYMRHTQFLVLAYYDNEFRPPINGRTRWLGVDNQPLMDNSWVPSHWAYPTKMPPVEETTRSWATK